jgi:hypothetical protein
MSFPGIELVQDVFSPGFPSMRRHSPLHINAILRTLWHAVYTIINEVLAYVRPSLDVLAFRTHPNAETFPDVASSPANNFQLERGQGYWDS